MDKPQKLNFPIKYLNQRLGYVTKNANNIVIQRTFTLLGALNFVQKSFV